MAEAKGRAWGLGLRIAAAWILSLMRISFTWVNLAQFLLEDAGLFGSPHRALRLLLKKKSKRAFRIRKHAARCVMKLRGHRLKIAVRPKLYA